MAQAQQTLLKLDLSGDSSARAARFERAVKALGKAEGSVWTAMCAIVRADGLDGIPQIPRDAKTAANAASEIRKLAKLGKLAELFSERDGAIMALSQRDVRALIKASKDAPNVGNAADDDGADEPAPDMAPTAAEIDTAAAAKHAADVLQQRLAIMAEALATIARLNGKAGKLAAEAIAAAEALK